MVFIEKIVIKNYKIFENFELEFNENLNILVGNNETGKSTVLEVIEMALTRKLYGRYLDRELSPYMFNTNAVNDYLQSLKTGNPKPPPEIHIELYFNESDETSKLRGNNNSKSHDACGVYLSIVFDDSFKEEYLRYIRDIDTIKTMPIEYYKINWLNFANNSITSRSLPVSSILIDSSVIKLQSGVDYYIRKIINDNLTPSERAELSLDYRKLKEDFADKEYLKKTNNMHIENYSLLRNKELSVSLDVSSSTSWETALTVYSDNIPFHYLGQGDQSILKIFLALQKDVKDSSVILIEEPENHLSFSNLNQLLKQIEDNTGNKQLIITTHSTFVVNKLGMNNLILIKNNKCMRLPELNKDTYRYFKKLPGYDTLRLVLADKTILVEGPSDELIVQKAYYQINNKIPLEDGIDVISVRGLSFKRFLDIAVILKTRVNVITDNDGDTDKNITEKYKDYQQYDNIKICHDDNNNSPSLEHQLVDTNGIDTMNKLLDKDFNNKDKLLSYMNNNKTACALKIIESEEEFNIPEYIKKGITFE